MRIVGGGELLQQVFLLLQQSLIGLTGTLHERFVVFCLIRKRVNFILMLSCNLLKLNASLCFR